MQSPGADPVVDTPECPSRGAPRSAPAPRRSTGAGRVLAGLLALAVTAVALVTALPGALGLAGTVPLAQLLPFRGVLVVVLVVAAAVVVAGAGLARLVVRRRRGPGGGRRRGPGPAALLAAGLVLAALVHAGVLVSRGVVPAAPPDEADLVVLSLNTEHGGASAQQVAAAVEDSRADVVVLPETPAATAQEVVAVLRERGAAFTATTASTSPAPTHATSLLVADRLGAAAPAPAPAVELAAVAAAPASLPGPVVAVHPVAPVPEGTTVQRWRADVPRAVAACTGAPGAVVAGDFNATLDHPALRDLGPCVDAAAQAGAGGLGTWPAAVPQLLSAPIDHVLVDGRAWEVLSARVVVVGTTDHRGLVVHLDRR